MNHQSGVVQFDQVRSEELAEIERRFARDDRDPLVGLAFSGGGIRSATFGLGVLQALKDLNLLDKIHYLSTVSGGGYIGSWLTANCARQRDWLEKPTDWDESVRHLRRYSNYLSPDVGVFSADSWSMFTVWIRNALLVQLTVVLAIACVLTAPRVLIVLFDNWASVGDWRWVSILLFLLGVAGIAGNETRVSRLHELKLLKAKAWIWGGAGAAVLIAAAWLYGVYMQFDPFPPNGPLVPVRLAAAVPIALLLVAAAFLLQPVAVRIVGVFKREAPTQVNYTQSWVQGAVVLPMLATGFLVAAILWSQSLVPKFATFDSYGQLFLNTWRYWPFPLSVMFFSIWLLSFCGVTSLKKLGWLVATLAPVVCVVVLHALLCAILLLHTQWTSEPFDGLRHAFVFTPALVLFAFALTIVMLIGMIGRRSTEGIREWWSRLGAWLAIYGTAWMIIAIAAVYGPDGARWLFHLHPKISFGAAATWITTVAGGLFAGNSESTGGQRTSQKGVSKLQVLALVGPFVFIAGLLVLVALGIDEIVRLNTADLSWSSVDSSLGWSSTFLMVSSIVLGACAAALAIMAWRIDINEFSLNAFYRNRLVRCYLGASRFEKRADGSFVDHRKPQKFTGFDDRDDIPLADLTVKRKPEMKASTEGVTDAASLGLVDARRGPLHLVNCALNLGGSSDLALHTRHSASFTLSSLHCGSSYKSRTMTGAGEPLGYVPTARYGGAVGAPTLGQAISVSGAAASPNMGYHTSPVVAFLLTVFNIRLGWWFPNPAKESRSKDAAPSPRFNLPYLFAELFGLATDKSRFLMISDGGHFENLAVYELIKRRCAVIIVSDAECDPNLAFEGLGTLIRVCDVDFHTKIRIDVQSIRPTKDSLGWSGRRCAIGTIEYPGTRAQQGILIYLKASMTGHEDTSILQYKASHQAFPHESTGDQFYREDQFESYRALGYDVASRTFAAVGEQSDEHKTILERARKLQDVWSPELAHVDRFTDQTERLSELWHRIGASPGFSDLDEGTTGSSGAPADRELFYLCCEMIQLMENTYLDLSLDDTWDHPDNAGWKAMFLNWSRCPAIKDTWSRTSTIFGTRFQFFCNRRLDLPLPK